MSTSVGSGSLLDLVKYYAANAGIRTKTPDDVEEGVKSGGSTLEAFYGSVDTARSYHGAETASFLDTRSEAATLIGPQHAAATKLNSHDPAAIQDLLNKRLDRGLAPDSGEKIPGFKRRLAEDNGEKIFSAKEPTHQRQEHRQIGAFPGFLALLAGLRR